MTETFSKNGEIGLRVIEKWCKGCVICVDMCPHDVLVMENGIVKVDDIEKCTACNICELHCPDFAIVVIDNRKKNKKK